METKISMFKLPGIASATGKGEVQVDFSDVLEGTVESIEVIAETASSVTCLRFNDLEQVQWLTGRTTTNYAAPSYNGTIVETTAVFLPPASGMLPMPLPVTGRSKWLRRMRISYWDPTTDKAGSSDIWIWLRITYLSK